MRSPEELAPVYEALADRFAAQNKLKQRDQCYVLAADAALTAGRAGEAERLRQRLLLQNPHHLLRPYASMDEAMQVADIQEYVAEVRGQWPPDVVEKLHASEPEPVEPPPMPPRPVRPAVVPVEKPRPPVVLAAAPAVSPYEPPPMPPRPAPAPAVPPLASWLATMLFFAGLVFALGVFFFAFVWPLLD